MKHNQNIGTESQDNLKLEVQAIDNLLIQGPLAKYEWEINLASKQSQSWSIEKLTESTKKLIAYFGLYTGSVNYQFLFEENNNLFFIDRRGKIEIIYINLYKKLLEHKSRIKKLK